MSRFTAGKKTKGKLGEEGGGGEYHLNECAMKFLVDVLVAFRGWEDSAEKISGIEDSVVLD